MKTLIASLLTLLWSAAAFGQAAVQQGGAWSAGRVPIYSASGGSTNPIVQQSAPASGGAQSISELSLVARGSGSAPHVGQGTGYLGSILCAYDGPITGQYHQLCLSPNATGGKGLLSYNAFGGAAAQGFNFVLNGTTYEFPFSTSGVVGPGTTTVGHMAVWNNTTGTLLADGGLPLTIGGTNGQIIYNNAGALGGFTVGGDGTINTGTGSMTISKIGGQNATLGGALTTTGAFSTVGNDAVTLTTTADSNVTLPTTGTLATRAGSEALTNKTYNGLTINSTTGTFALTNGKTLTVSNTLQFTGTDGSTLNIGTGGTLGTAAYTAATAYVPSNTQITNSIAGDVALNNTANYFTGPSVAQGSTGTWFCSGQVTLLDTTGAANFYAKLWDGTTVVDSAFESSYLANAGAVIHLSGYLANPAGNMRISARDTTTTTGVMAFNSSGNSKDSTLTCLRTN